MAKEKNKKPEVADSIQPIVRGSTMHLTHELGDFFANTQKTIERIGDVGEISEKYKDKAFHQLANDPDKFIAPITYGTIGRSDNKNYNRMEYDTNVRFDKKDQGSVLNAVNEEKEVPVKKLLDVIKPKDLYMVNTTDTMVSRHPIKFESSGFGDLETVYMLLGSADVSGDLKRRYWAGTSWSDQKHYYETEIPENVIEAAIKKASLYNIMLKSIYVASAQFNDQDDSFHNIQMYQEIPSYLLRFADNQN